MTNESNFRDGLLDDLTTILDGLANEHCVDDFALMEALSVDMLSEEETRSFAEHLETCAYCRQECETLFETGAYEGTPFDERLKRCASETNDDWKKIAAVFNPALATTASVRKTTPTIPLEENVPRSRSQIDAVVKSRAFGRQWILCASAAIMGAVVATSLDFFSDSAPTVEQARLIEKQARRLEVLEAELVGAKGGATGETASQWNENLWTPTAEILRLNFSPEEAERTLAQMATRRGGDTDSLASLAADLDELKLVEAVYRGALAFKEGRFDEAVDAFKAATSETPDEDTLWNLAVATAKSGDVEAARKIFEALRDSTTSEEMRALVERALNYWRVDNEK